MNMPARSFSSKLGCRNSNPAWPPSPIRKSAAWSPISTPWTRPSRAGLPKWAARRRRPLKIFSVLFFILGLLSSSPLHASETQAPPPPAPKYHRIISLKPNLTEILFALGVGNSLVGVTTFCDEPPDARTLDKVADYIQPDLEKIVMKRPDLIVTSQENSSKREIFFLRDRGYKVLTLEAEDFEQLRKTILVLGEELGRSEEAKELVLNLDGQLSALQKKVQGLLGQTSALPKALFVV